MSAIVCQSEDYTVLRRKKWSHRTVRKLLKIIVCLLASLVTFTACLFGMVRLQVGYYGSKAFEHDAGASFAAFIIADCAAAAAAILVGYLLFRWIKLPNSSN
jgi:hypothetical protein